MQAYMQVVGHSPTFHKLLLQASADCHCMLAGESRTSSKYMTISAFYRTQKLQFNVPRTYLYLFICPTDLFVAYICTSCHWLIQAYSNGTISLSHHFHLLTIVLFTQTFYLMAKPVSVLKSVQAYHSLLHAFWSLSLFSNSFDHHSPIISF